MAGLLALLGFLGAATSLVHALQFLGVLPFSLGAYRFFGAEWLAALLWALLAGMYAWDIRKIWMLDSDAPLILTLLSVMSLLLVGLAIVGESSVKAILPSLAVSALILFYGLLPRTRTTFGFHDSGELPPG